MKLSVIVPIYNVEGYLAKCLDSLIYEGLDNYEILCVDDGSTDGSGAIAAQYAERYPALIRVLSQENGGLGAARNTGIDAAQGEYLLFVDSDDYLAEGALSEIFRTLEQDFDICVFGMLSVSESGALLDDIPSCPVEGPLSLASWPRLLLLPASACNKLCRRSLFTEHEIRFPGRVWYEDLCTMPKLYLLTDKVISVKSQWYIYLQRSGSIINSARLERNLEIIDAVDAIVAYYREQGQYESYKAELDYLVFYNQLLTASARVCLADPSSPVLDGLLEDFLRKLPDYRDNPYVRQLPLKHRLLSFLIVHRLRRAAGSLMRLNAAVKGKA